MPSPTPPLLFLDVDGPLIPFGADLPEGYPVHEPARPVAAPHPLLTRVNPALGPRLLALPCTLVWATTWMSDANALISPWLGLPDLPVVDWPDPAPDSPGLHWKTRPLLSWAAGRTFAWIDDEIAPRDRAWLSAHHPGRVLAHRVDGRRGLTDYDFAALDAWLRTHE